MPLKRLVIKEIFKAEAFVWLKENDADELYLEKNLLLHLVHKVQSAKMDQVG